MIDSNLEELYMKVRVAELELQLYELKIENSILKGDKPIEQGTDYEPNY